MFLAELGAAVIKIERPDGNIPGDVTRSWLTAAERLAQPENNDGRSSYFNAINWGKKSLLADFNNPDDLGKILEMAETADIVLTSFKPGDAQKFGLDEKTILSRNPGCIYATITGFGSADPRPAYDALIQAEAGFMYLNREPGAMPAKMPVALMDVLAAHHLKELILAAFIEREKTGKGVYLDVSLFEAAVSSLVNQASLYLSAGIRPEPMGSEHPNIYPYGSCFRTAEQRDIVLAVGTDSQFFKLCTFLGIPEVFKQQKFSTNPQRSVNRDELRSILENAFSTVEHTNSFLEKIQAAGIPAALVKTVPEAIEAYRGSFKTHKNGSIEGLPQLTGRVNEIPAAGQLNAPPVIGKSISQK